eukprot:5246613-Pyramimonas_sp.AAC.1
MGTAIVNVFFGEASHGATKGCTGRGGRKHCAGRVEIPNWVCETHAGGRTGGFGGAPHGATKRCPG